MIYTDEFTPFFGTVEDINDPMSIGRVRVRAHGYHTDNPGLLPTEQLPWFSSVVSNSAGFNGAGSSPTGYLVGTTVFGFFVDKSYQIGIVIGSLMGMTNSVPDISGLATGALHPLKDIRERNRIKDVQGPLENDDEEDPDETPEEREKRLAEKRWGEPEYTNNASYPNNYVYETPSGLIREMDSTPGKERIHEFHPSGTFYEVSADGSRTVKVIGDNYEIVAGKNNIYIRGDCNMTIDGNFSQLVKGNYTLQVDGNKTEVIQGSTKEFYTDQSTQATGTKKETSGEALVTAGEYTIHAGRILLNE